MLCYLSCCVYRPLSKVCPKTGDPMQPQNTANLAKLTWFLGNAARGPLLAPRQHDGPPAPFSTHLGSRA